MFLIYDIIYRPKIKSYRWLPHTQRLRMLDDMDAMAGFHALDHGTRHRSGGA